MSKKRMDLGIPVRNGGPDIAMLFLAMKLITALASGRERGRSQPVKLERFKAIYGDVRNEMDIREEVYRDCEVFTMCRGEPRNDSEYWSQGKQ